MKFRTGITYTDSPRNLSPESLLVLTGSCFSDNIGNRLAAAGWPAAVNPCGVIYNPVSMAILYRLALTHRTLRREIIASSLTEREGRYVSWFMGSKVSGATPEECTDNACECIDILEEALEKAEAAILTFGTSDVWLLAGTDRAVGNCHKHPASEFEKKRVSVEEMTGLWTNIIDDLRERNPDIKIILTVSPRRYLSEGFAENTRQKAVLILGCEQLSRIPGVTYFPSYEILNDDLRDYRFYAKDMLHPSEAAIEYVWEKFLDCYLRVDCREKLKEMEKEMRRKRHIPLTSRQHS